MITYKTFKEAFKRYSDTLAKIRAEKSTGHALYDLLLADSDDVVGNDAFIVLFNHLDQCTQPADGNPDGLLSKQELFALLHVLMNYSETIDGKLLVEAFDKAMGTSLDDGSITNMSRILFIMETCKEDGLFNLANLEKMMQIFSTKNTLSSLAHTLRIFCDTSLPLNQTHLDAMLSRGIHGCVGNQMYNLSEAGLLTSDKAQANFDLFMANAEKSYNDETSFFYLNQYQLLTQENFDKLMAYPHDLAFVNFFFGHSNDQMNAKLMKQSNLDLIFADPERGTAFLIWAKEQDKDYYCVSQEMLDGFMANFGKEKEIPSLQQEEDAPEAGYSSDSSSSSNYSPRLFDKQAQESGDAVMVADSEKLPESSQPAPSFSG